MTPAERLVYQRERRKQNGNADTRKYEKTPKGFLMRMYRNMQSRVTGVQHLKAHLYKGKPLLGRQDFYDWATSSPDFEKMFRVWEDSNYDRKLAPTVDRKDSSLGYKINNMQWLTHSENSRKGCHSRFKTND